MRELSSTEIDEVSGGLSTSQGGVALVGLAVTAAVVATGPVGWFAAGFAMSTGIGLLFAS